MKTLFYIHTFPTLNSAGLNAYLIEYGQFLSHGLINIMAALISER